MTADSKFKLFFILLLSFFLLGCEEPRINGSSDLAFHISSKRMVSAQPEAQREDIEAALSRLVLAIAFDQTVNQDEAFRQLREKLHGMNAQEVLQYAISEDRRQLVELRDQARAAVVLAQTELVKANAALKDAPDDELLLAAKQRIESDLAVAVKAAERRAEQIGQLDRGEDW